MSIKEHLAALRREGKPNDEKEKVALRRLEIFPELWISPVSEIEAFLRAMGRAAELDEAI